MAMTIADLQSIQAHMADRGQACQVELREGAVLVMGPSDIVSSLIGARLCYFLQLWINPRRLGMVFDSSGGFILPNSDLTAPDVAYVSRSRMPRSGRYFAEVVPNLVVEIKSQSDRVAKLREKLAMYLEQGAEVALLVDPDQEIVEIYRPDGSIQVLGNGEIMQLPDLLPSWELAIAELWPPTFDEDLDSDRI